MASDSGRRQRWGRRERESFLSGVPLFQHLTPETSSAVAAAFQPRSFDAGAFVFVAGAAAEAVHLLVAGRIKVIRETEEGQEVILRLIQPRELFGGAGAWGETHYPASAVAMEQATVFRLPARSFSALLEQHPDFARAVIEELARRLRVAERRIEELQTERVERRIAHTLLRLADGAGVKTAEGIRIDIPLSRQDLAELAGTTLSTASRTLSRWAQQGLIVAGRERVVICRPHALVAIAEDLAPPSAPDP